jgi:hypothetical protein
MQQLLKLVDQLALQAPNATKRCISVSEGAVGWHIEHSLLVITQIIEGVKRSDPSKYKWTFNFSRLVVLASNKIPRGKAKAPQSVLPSSDMSANSLLVSVAKTKLALMELATCQKNNYFIHPYFGQLNKAATIRFFEVHTYHHFKIIRDILKYS